MKRIILLGLCILLIVSIKAQDKAINEEDIIGITYYDFHTLRTVQNRIYSFDDGTIGSVWNLGQNFPQFTDLRIGYNYFDGSSWAPQTTVITSQWARHPSYAPCLVNGELVAYETLDGIGFS